MERKKVESSNIESVGYDPEKLILEVEFENSGVYEYYGVDDDIYQSFMKDTSLGRFFGKHIRGKFESKKLT